MASEITDVEYVSLVVEEAGGTERTGGGGGAGGYITKLDKLLHLYHIQYKQCWWWWSKTFDNLELKVVLDLILLQFPWRNNNC